MSYDYNPAQQNARFDPDVHAKQMAMAQQDIRAAFTGGIAGSGNALGGDIRSAQQQGGVTREMQYLEKNLHALANAIDLLNARLAAACIAAPETAPGLRGVEPSGCALANQLAAFNGMLSHQITRLEMLYQGIDL